MNSLKYKPLDHIELNNGIIKAVSPTNDYLWQYTFEKSENWHGLPKIANILLEDYKIHYPKISDDVKLIENEVVVETQYKYMLDEKNTRFQDFKLNLKENNAKNENITFIELQNKAYTNPPIENRSIEYQALGIINNRDKIINQLWIMTESNSKLLHNNSYADYRQIDRISSNEFPVGHKIIYADLSKIKTKDNKAGELARFLIGKDLNPKHPEVREIAELFKLSVQVLKNDKEAKERMSFVEGYRYEGELIGIEKGIIESIRRLIINTDMKYQNIAKAFEVDMETIKDAYTQIISNISDIGERVAFMEKRPSDFETNVEIPSPSLFKK